MSWFSRLHVEPPVVEREGRSRCAASSVTRSMKACFSAGDPAAARDAGGRSPSSRTHDSRLRSPASSAPLRGWCRRRRSRPLFNRSAVTSALANSHGPGQSAKYRANGVGVHHLLGELVRAREVRPAAALRMQPPAGSQRPEDAGEERRMILDPVKRRRAEDEIGPAGKRQVGQRRPARTRRASRARAAGWRARSSACSTIDRSRSAGRAAAAPSARRSAGRCRIRRRWRARRRARSGDPGPSVPSSSAARKPCDTTRHSIQSCASKRRSTLDTDEFSGHATVGGRAHAQRRRGDAPHRARDDHRGVLEAGLQVPAREVVARCPMRRPT